MSSRTGRFPRADQGFEQFVREAGPSLLRLAHVLTMDRAAAEDLAQDTLVRVGLAWSRVDPDGAPVAYARRTMINAYLNQRRRARRSVPVADVPEPAAEDEALTAVEGSGEVAAMLAVLPPRQRAAVALRYVVGLDDDEIGRLLGCSSGTVRSQVSRALSTLREQAGRSER